MFSQISQLEQEKAELRREKIGVAEENRKLVKLEEQVSALKRELDIREKASKEGREQALLAKAEAEEIRHNAQSSIEQWALAEKQWLEDEAKLKERLSDVEERLRSSLTEVSELRQTNQKLDVQCLGQRDRASQYEKRCLAMEADLRQQHEQLEQHRSKLFACEKELLEMNRVKEKLEETLELREVELQEQSTLRSRMEEENEALSSNLRSMQDRINKEKVAQMDLLHQKELQACDVQSAKKDLSHLQLLLESERKERALADRRQEETSKALEETKEKLSRMQEDLRAQRLTSHSSSEEAHQLRKLVAKQEADLNALTLKLQTAEEKREEESERVSVLLNEMKELREDLEVQQQLGRENLEKLCLLESTKAEEIENLLTQLRQHEAQASVYQSAMGDLTREVQRHEEERLDMVAEIAYWHSEFDHTAQSALGLEAFKEKSELEAAFQLEHKVPLWATAHARLVREVCELQCSETNVKEALEAALERGRQAEQDRQRMMVSHSELEEKCEMLLVEVDGLTAREREDQLLLQRVREEKEGLGVLLEQVKAEKGKVEAELESLQEALTERTKDSQTEKESLLSREAQCLQAMLQAMESKSQFVYQTAASYAERFIREGKELRSKKTVLEEKTQELERLLDSSHQLLSQQQSGREEVERGLRAELAQLEHRLSSETRERAQIESQLQSTLSRWEQERHEWESAKAKEAAVSLAKLEAAERTVEKLQRGLHAELSRKGEYKAALAEVKLRREAADRARAEEHEVAVREVEKANTEILYWREHYHQLRAKYKSLREEKKQEKSTKLAEGIQEPQDGDTHRDVNCMSNASASPAPQPLQALIEPGGVASRAGVRGEYSRSPLPTAHTTSVGPSGEERRNSPVSQKSVVSGGILKTAPVNVTQPQKVEKVQQVLQNGSAASSLGRRLEESKRASESPPPPALKRTLKRLRFEDDRV